MNILRAQEFRFAALLGRDNLLVSCHGAQGVLVADKDRGVQESCIESDFSKPEGVAVSITGNIFVVDRFHHCVKVFDDTLTLKHALGGPGVLNQPVGVAFDDAEGEVYVADNENHRIAVFAHHGAFLRAFGSAASLYCPCGVALFRTAKGALYVIVAEWGSGRVQVFHDGQSVLSVSGFPHAHHVVVSPEGDVYVALYSDKCVRRIQIRENDDGTPRFVIDNARTQLEDSPCSLFWDDGRLGVVTRSRVLFVPSF